MATYIYDYHDERGEFHAYVRDEAGNIIWEVHYPEYLEDDDTGELLEGSTIFEDGYLKNADDLEGLYYYLRDFGAIEEDDEVVKLEDYGKREDAKDNLLDFAIPSWAMSAIVNDDRSGLEDEDIQKIDAFENRLVELYGNANLMLGDVDGEDNLGLTMGNDIEENAMTECYRMYLRPTKSYEDGGALMDGQYGYGTSYLAKGGALEDKIKKKLGENFELPIEMAVYVPSTEKANQIISKRDYASRIDEVRSYLANLFGGYSSEGIDGGYVSDEKGLIQEDVTKVTAFATKENFEQKLDSLITQIKKWCGDWGQESMGFEFEGDLFYISKDGKFMDGGNIPEGYHMMPDGTIMPDSAHLDGGGEVDDDEDEDKEQEHLEYVSEETNIPIDVLKEYANNKGIKIEDLDTDLGYQGSFSDEEAFAQYCANEGLISNLSYYLEMYPTDKRILIGEMTDNYINDLSDEDILSQSSYDDDFEKLKEVEANLSIQEGELENLIDEKQDLVDSQDVESMRESDREEMDRALEEFDQKIEDVEATISSIKDDIRDIGDYDDIIERAREEVRDNYYDDLKDRLDKDAVGYFVDELGYDENDLVDKNGFYVDTSALARDLGHDYDFIEYEGDVYVFSSYYKYGGGIDLGSSFDKFKKSLNILPQEIQSQISDNDAINMAIQSVGDAWEDLTDYDRSLIVKSFKEGYNKGSYAKGGEFKVDPKYTHFAVGKRDGKIVTGWEYKDLDKESIKYYTKVDLVDMDFKPSDFRILTAKYLKAQGVDPFNWDNWRKHGDNYYAHGGSVEEGNLEMLKNQAKEFKHHAEELGEVVDKNPRVDAWVVAKAERATSDLSDITHYLEGQEDGESFKDGGELLSDVDMYVKIHGYYPMEVMALRGEGIGQAIVRNEAHNFELSGVDSRKAEEMGYEFDYDKKGWVEVEEDDDDFAKGGSIDDLDEIKKGDYVNFGEYGNFYVVDTDYLIDGTHFWVTRDKENRTNSQAPGYTILKGDAQYIIEKYSNDDDYAKGGEVEKKEYINKYIKDLGLDVEEMPARQYRYLSKQASRKYEKEKLEKMPYRKYRVSYRIPFGAIHSTVVDARTSNEARTIFRKTHGRDIQGNQDKILSVTLTKVKKDKSVIKFNRGGKLGFSIGDIVALKNIPENLPYEIREGIIENKWEISRVSMSGRSMFSDVMEDVFGYEITILDPSIKYIMFVYPDEIKSYLRMAKGGEVDEKLSKTDLKKLEKVGGKTGQRARLAETLKGLGKKKKMAKGGQTKFINLTTRKGQSEVEKYTSQGWGIKFQNDKFAILEKGLKKKLREGGATFDEKVKAISKNLKGRKVPKKLQKDYGKTYDTKEERDDAARRIAGAMRAEEMGTRKK